MKTLIILSFIILSTLWVSASEKSGNSYIIVGNETFYCDMLRVGKGSTKAYLGGKRLLKMPTQMIDAYSQNGVVFEKMPIICKNNDTAGWAFMQLISSRNGYSLYRFCSNCIHYDPAEGIINPIYPVYRYYIFKKGKFVSLVDENNAKEQLAKFGVKMLK
ncbi:MAG: hypothetical protein IPH45_19980 [Bacteroidales bacterium]|nr:hypothetical protein [Bacteroidales bacterium]